MAKEKPSNSFPVGTKVEVRSDAEGFIGSWFEAVVTDYLTESNRAKYKVKYLTLMKDDEPDQPEIDEVNVHDVRPAAPRRVEVAGEEEGSEFQMHELVEAYHAEGWWYGLISGLRNPVTGKYRVSFPLSREVIDFYPSDIRRQMEYINGNWFSRKPKQQKNSYKVGAKVEAIKICEKYGRSWFPATVQKIIPDDNFLVKYENEEYLPYGHLIEIVDFSSLRPVLDRNPKSNKIELNSDVEVFNEGAWTNGVVTSVRSNGKCLVRVCENDDVTPLLVNGDFIRLRLEWDWKKWSKFRNLGKRGRLEGEERSSSAKKKKNDDLGKEEICDETNMLLSELKKNKTMKNDISTSPSDESPLKKHLISHKKKENCLYYKRTKRAVAKCPRSKLHISFDSSTSSEMKIDKYTSPEATESSKDSLADVGADISKVKMVNLQNGGHEQTSPNQVPNPLNPNLNNVPNSLNPNPNQVPALELPFESICPDWIWTSVQKLDVFKKTPQKPHFANLKTCCDNDELEGRAFSQMITYYNISNSINTLSLDTDFSEFNKKLRILDSLEQDGFETDPLRTLLLAKLELKKEFCESGLKMSELERELNEKFEDSDEINGNLEKINIELAEVRETERRLKERREREMEKRAGIENMISKLKSEMDGLVKNGEIAKEKFLSLRES